MDFSVCCWSDYRHQRIAKQGDECYNHVRRDVNNKLISLPLKVDDIEMEWRQSVYIGHKRDDGTLQPLKSHLEAVSISAAEFARPFGGTEHARRVGLMHDIGKYSQAGQHRMMNTDSMRKVDHSTAGAQEVIHRFNDYAGAFAIAGHHGGLPDMGNRADCGGSTLMGRNGLALKGELDYSQWRSEIVPQNKVVMPAWLNVQNPWQVQF